MRQPDDELADPLVGELRRDSRDRRVLAISAAIGIVAGAVLGMIFIVGAVTEATQSARGFFRHRAILVVLGAPLASLAIGYAIYRLRVRRRG